MLTYWFWSIQVFHTSSFFQPEQKYRWTNWPWEVARAVPVEEAYVKAWGALSTQEYGHAAEIGMTLWKLYWNKYKCAFTDQQNTQKLGLKHICSEKSVSELNQMISSEINSNEIKLKNEVSDKVPGSCEQVNSLVPFPTQRISLTKRSNASHSGLSKGSKHSLHTHFHKWAL